MENRRAGFGRKLPAGDVSFRLARTQFNNIPGVARKIFSMMAAVALMTWFAIPVFNSSRLIHFHFSPYGFVTVIILLTPVLQPGDWKEAVEAKSCVSARDCPPYLSSYHLSFLFFVPLDFETDSRLFMRRPPASPALARQIEIKTA